MATLRIENLPLDWVRSFETAGRLGSFTSAADEMNLTQAAVSQRIANLENHIGAQLFKRQPRGVTLTIEGEAWLPHVSQALLSLRRSAEELFGKPLERILISASSSINQLWVAPRLANLPVDARYQISMTTMNIDPDFAKANASIEIRFGVGEWAETQKHLLFHEVMTPLVNPALLKTQQRWQDLPIIAVSGPRPGWQQWAEYSADNSSLLPRYRFDSFVAAHAAAVAGLGVVLGSLPLCKQSLQNGKLSRITKSDLKLKTGYWMVGDHDRLPQKQWDEMVGCLTTSPTSFIPMD